MIGFIAYHYPRSDEFTAFIERTKLVRETLLKQAGCQSVEIWATPDNEAVVTTGTFDSEVDYHQAFEAAGEMGDTVAFDDREVKPREIVSLVSP